MNIRIVLVETSHPGNIGGVARAMKNMCLSELYLVAPKEFPSAEATARASGADDVLERAQVFDSLDAALSDCALVIGASARLRSVPWPQIDPRECGRLAVDAARTTAPVALVFGRERTGLTNEELERCQRLVHIPSNPDYSSLNLAAAVQIIAYEVLVASGARNQVHDIEPDAPPTTGEDLARFYEHLEKVLADIDFLDPANPKHLMRRLKRLFNRVGLDEREVQILRGILTAVERYGRRSS